MGGVVSSIGDFIGSAVNAVGDNLGTVLPIAAAAVTGDPALAMDEWGWGTGMDAAGSGMLDAGLGSAGAAAGGAMDMSGSFNNPTSSNTIFGGNNANPMPAGNSGLLGTLNNFLGSPVGGAVGQSAQALLFANKLRGLAQQQGQFSSLDQPQRQPYQGNLSQLVNNPSQYLNTDPYATSLRDYYKNSIIPRNIAQSGNPAQVLDQQGSQFVQALSGNYNTQMGNLSGIAGFGFPQSQYAGYGAGQIGSQAALSQASGLGSFGNALGMNMGKPLQGQAGTTGLFGTGIS